MEDKITVNFESLPFKNDKANFHFPDDNKIFKIGATIIVTDVTKGYKEMTLSVFSHHLKTKMENADDFLTAFLAEFPAAGDHFLREKLKSFF